MGSSGDQGDVSPARPHGVRDGAQGSLCGFAVVGPLTDRNHQRAGMLAADSGAGGTRPDSDTDADHHRGATSFRVPKRLTATRSLPLPHGTPRTAVRYLQIIAPAEGRAAEASCAEA
jgi:hypothetical protein